MAPIFLVLIVSAMAVGCGGDESADGNDGSANGDSSQLTKTEFIKKAEALCLRSTEKALEGIVPEMERIQKRNPDVKESQGELHAGAIVSVLLPALEKQIDEIRDLGIPAGDEQEVNRILATEQRLIDATREDPPNANSVAKVGVELRNKFIPLDKVGRPYGFDTCAYGGLQ